METIIVGLSVLSATLAVALLNERVKYAETNEKANQLFEALQTVRKQRDMANANLMVADMLLKGTVAELRTIEQQSHEMESELCGCVNRIK